MIGTASFPILESLTGAGAFGEAEAVDAANLTRDIHAWVTAAVSEKSGRQVKTLLDRLAGSLPETALSALSDARTLANRSQERVKELQAMQERLNPLRKQLDTAIAIFRANLEPPLLSDDALQEAAIRSLLETRIAHFLGLIGGLERCGILVEKLLSTERLAEDQFAILRDATTPITVQGASLCALRDMSDDMDALDHEIESFCKKVISADAARLHKLSGPAARPSIRLFGRQKDRP